MMKKNILLLAILSITSISFGKKEKLRPKIQLSFISEQNKTTTDFASKENFDYCIETLKSFATIQEQRRLTLEETMHAMRALMYLFLIPNDDYSKKIEVLLLGKTLTLPYSEDLMAEMLGKNETEQQSNEQ